MRGWLLAGLITVALAANTACGDDSSPTAPGPGANALAILPATDFLTIGSAATFQARLTETGGAARVVAADWSSDDGRIAAVDRQGRVSALSAGSTTVRAAFEGRTATQALRVAPDYAGTWAGARRVISCVHPTPDFCTINYAPGRQFDTRLVLTQVRDRVSGSFLFAPPAASPTATLLGDIAANGQLALAGSISAPTTTGGPLVFVGSVVDWRAQIDAVQPVLLGSFTEQRVDPNGTAWRVSWELLGLGRTSVAMRAR